MSEEVFRSCCIKKNLQLQNQEILILIQRPNIAIDVTSLLGYLHHHATNKLFIVI